MQVYGIVIKGPVQRAVPAFSLTKASLIQLYPMSSSHPKRLGLNFCFIIQLPYLRPIFQTGDFQLNFTTLSFSGYVKEEASIEAICLNMTAKHILFIFRCL